MNGEQRRPGLVYLPELATAARMPPAGRLPDPPAGIHLPQQGRQGSLKTGTPERARFTRVHPAEDTATYLRCIGLTEVRGDIPTRDSSTPGNYGVPRVP
jgi:hypothetical protein